MAISNTKHLPPHVRQRLTLRGALLSGPRRLVKSVKSKSKSVPKEKPKRARSFRRRPSAKTKETQTIQMVDAVTSTAVVKFVRIQYPKKLKKKSIFTAWMKKSREEPSPSFIPESGREPRELRGILKTESRMQYPNKLEKKSTVTGWTKKSSGEPSPSFIVESEREPYKPRGILKPKSILKKPRDETMTKVIWPGPKRKQSNLSSILKKRVKLEIKAISSYFIKRVIEKKESLSSLGSDSEDESSEHEELADGDVIKTPVRESSGETSPSSNVESEHESKELRGTLEPENTQKKSEGETVVKETLPVPERKRSNLSRNLNKRVKLEKKTVSSDLCTKVMEKKESMSSVGSKSEDEESKHEVADNIKSSSVTSTEVPLSLERKSARCVLDEAPPARTPQKTVSFGSGRVSTVSILDVKQLLAPPQLKLPRRRIPKDRLFFKNVV